MTKAAVMASALELSPAERLELVEELWDSLAEHAEDVPLTDEMRAELDRRLAEHEANPE
jgi:putative addiction module component (TIGR02574 family)